jgi:hypothetical protein
MSDTFHLTAAPARGLHLGDADVAAVRPMA